MTETLFGNLEQSKSAAPPGRREQLTFRGNARNGRHGWLRLTPAYGLKVVEDLLDGAASDEWILDPFSGTGTTALAAAEKGFSAHAVDINPFLVWFGNLKTHAFPGSVAGDFEKAAKDIVRGLRRVKVAKALWVPNIHAIEKWWDEPALTSLAMLFDRIKRSERSRDAVVVDLLKVAFCRASIEVANVSFGHQSMSFKKREVPTEQQVLLSTVSAEDPVWSRFLAVVDAMADSVERGNWSCSNTIFQGDSRHLEDALPRTDYSLVITSPPYPNRMSYIRELRPYMYWLGYLETGRDAGELDWRTIGGTWGCATSNLGKWEGRGERGIPFRGFKRIVDEISAEHPLLGRYVQKYFEDIQDHLASLKQVLKDGARCYYVVGNSKFYGTLLPVERIYAALFEDFGFQDVRVETLRKRSSKKELFEYVVCAEYRR